MDLAVQAEMPQAVQHIMVVLVVACLAYSEVQILSLPVLLQ
jgi:hypothetical protein